MEKKDQTELFESEIEKRKAKDVNSKISGCGISTEDTDDPAKKTDHDEAERADKAVKSENDGESGRDDESDDSNDAVPDKRDFTDEILKIVRSGKSYGTIKELLEDYHDNDIAGALEELSPEERIRLYRILGIEATSDILSYVDEEDVGSYIEEMPSEKAADVIEAMDASDAVDVLDELDEEKRQEIMDLIEGDAVEDIKLIDSYDDDMIGSRMSTNYIVIAKDLNIKQAMRSMIDQAAENDNISTIYVENADGSFYGAIDLKELILARQDTELDSIVQTSYPYVYANETIEECIEELKGYSEDSIPVLSPDDDRILGVITAQELVEVVNDEFGEDYAKLAGLSSEDDLGEKIFKSVGKRLPWLFILLVLGLVVSSVVGAFEGVIASLPLVICFQSLVLDMSGNVGTQSLAVTIRVLMDDDVSKKDKLKLVFKEMRIGFINGLVLGVFSFVVIGIYLYLFKTQNMLMVIATAGCVGISLCIAMTISSLSGTIIPIILKAFKIDPAVASGPLITTINDLVAIVTYYGLSWLLLIEVLNLGAAVL